MLAHYMPQIARQIGAAILNRFVLADEAAQLCADGLGPLFLLFVRQHLGRIVHRESWGRDQNQAESEGRRALHLPASATLKRG